MEVVLKQKKRQPTKFSLTLETKETVNAYLRKERDKYYSKRSKEMPENLWWV